MPALTPDGSIDRLFCELVAIPSPSGAERAVGDAIAAWLAEHGVTSSYDAAGTVNGSDCGNLIARVPGGVGAPTLLFVAHMDTVESGSAPVVPALGSDGVIRSGGDTILGADNKSAVAAVMRLCAAAAAMPAAGRPAVTAAFTCREEAGRMGVSLLSADDARADCAFSVDGSRPIGTVITRALGQQVFTLEIRGRAAHAAADPEAGVNAIAVAGEIVAAMPLGRRPGGGSASVAAIAGGAVIDRLGRAAGAGGGAADGPAAGAAGAGDPGGEATVRAALDATPSTIRSPTWRCCGVSCAATPTMSWPTRAPSSRPSSVASARPAARDMSGMIASARSRRSRARPTHDRWRWPGRRRGGCAGVTFTTTEAHATLEANYLAASADVVALASGGSGPHQVTESITVGELGAARGAAVRRSRASSRPRRPGRRPSDPVGAGPITSAGRPKYRPLVRSSSSRSTHPRRRAAPAVPPADQHRVQEQTRSRRRGRPAAQRLARRGVAPPISRSAVGAAPSAAPDRGRARTSARAVVRAVETSVQRPREHDLVGRRARSRAKSLRSSGGSGAASSRLPDDHRLVHAAAVQVRADRALERR